MLYLKDKIIVITGGSGSLGQSLIKPLFGSGVKKIVIYSRNEYNQWKMEKKFSKEDYPIRYFLGDVRDKDRLHRAFSNVDIVIHAAAIKHIDKAQYDPIEAVKTNVMGTQHVIDAAIDNGVDKVLGISTDKSIAVSLYGATKLCSDFMLVAANNYSPKQTKFSVVRFGNFWNSSGSFIEYLLKQKNKKDTVIHITDERMTRFFITLDNAANFAIKCLKNMKGKEIFFPKMKARKIIDVVKEILPNCTIKKIDIRPGEKLYEEMLSDVDARNTYECEDYCVILPSDVQCGNSYCKLKKVNNNFKYSSNMGGCLLNGKY